MSKQSAMQPAVSIATTYFVPDSDPSNPPTQTNIAQQPNLSAPGIQTIAPSPSPSR